MGDWDKRAAGDNALGWRIVAAASRQARGSDDARLTEDEKASQLTRPADFQARPQRLGATSANIAPCGSRHCTIQLPPGTSIGPLTTLPPADVTRPTAASMASTLT